jgi:hypothetical protein
VAEFNNIFDTALEKADDTIREVMGTPAQILTGTMAGTILHGVFDDPENIGFAGSGVRVEGTSPSLFVKSVHISTLQRSDVLLINGDRFWVDRIGPDDSGSRHIWLGNGSPPAGNRAVRKTYGN